MAKSVSKVTQKHRGTFFHVSKLVEGTTRSFDGTRIEYRSFGHPRPGRPAIVCCNGLGVGTFFWVYLEKMFKNDFQVVTWNYRGHGNSELKKNPKNYSLEAIVKDCKAVLDTLGIKKSVLVGHSLGVQVSLEMYRRWPEMIQALVLCFGTYQRPMDSFFNMRISRYLFELFYHFGKNFPKQGSRVSQFLLDNPLSFWIGGLLNITHNGMIKKADIDRYIEHILAVDPLYFTLLLKSAQDHSAEDVLKKIKLPTLIITGERDQFTPMWISKKMHRLIPKSELFIMKNATHAGVVEQPDLMNLRIEKFLKERLGV